MVTEKERNIVLPEKYFDERFYVEQEPDPDYVHASVEAHEAFRDMKYGVRIHWGLYSILELNHESWSFLNMKYEDRQKYQEMYKTWNPEGFNAEEWMQFFERSGFKCLAFTTKHHEGFSMYDTKTRVKRRINWTAGPEPIAEDCDFTYSIMETPFGRDVVKELCDTAHEHGIKIDLYFSHPDWYDLDFHPYGHHPVLTEEAIDNPQEFCTDLLSVFSGRVCTVIDANTPEEDARMMQRHREQLTEILTNYGKIDMCCLDIRFGPRNWEYLRETIKILRGIQPDVMFRNRGIGNYGDYYTPEGFVPGDPSNTNMPWMVIYPLGSSFSYEADAEKYKGTKWVVHNLVDICAKGGNLMVGIGPGPNGTFHPEAISELEAAGEWIKINGAGIFGTRPWKKAWKEENTRFMATKDGKKIFAFMLEWPEDNVFRSKIVKPRKSSDIIMFGVDQPLPWYVNNGEIVIEIPDEIVTSKPCDYAWGLTIEI